MLLGMKNGDMASVDAGRRYGRTLVAWLVTVAGPPLMVVALIASANAARCKPESVDCSWGFEYLVAIPVLVLCALTLGPLAVYAVLRMAGDPLAVPTVRWAYVLVLPSLVLAAVFWGTYGLPAFTLPPLTGRYLARRRARRSDQG